jgi:gliding motility-associated-like protein
MRKFYARLKLKFLVLFTSFFILGIHSVNATHIVGGALTYVHNGGSNYTVTLKLYRDCSGNPLPNSVTIAVTGYNGLVFNPSKNFTINLTSSSFLPSNLDSCAQAPSPIPCVQEGIYTATVNNLPPNPGGYHLTYSICCRNLTTTNVDCSGNDIGERFYAFIPGYTMAWFEDFTLANGTITDAGATAWTRSLGTTPPNYASVQNNLFEIAGANNAQATWLSQSITISSFTSGVNLSVNLSENGNLDAGDSIIVQYSLNGGPFVNFAINGAIADDNALPAVATSGPLVGNTIQIRVRVHYDNNSPNSELYRFDNVTVYANDYVANSNPVFTNFPPLFLCQGNSFTFDHSATDANGDSLAYSFYTPYDDPAITYINNVAQFIPVIFQAPYTFTTPLGIGSISLDPQTGIITGSPTTLGQFIVGIKVREYRNGVLLSEMVRDFQFNVINCPPPAQALIIPGNAIDACNGVNVTFPNNSDAIANNWWWNFGDGTTLADTSLLEFPTYSYPVVGTYNVTLIINKGTSCADTSYATVDVGFATAAFTHNAPVCAGQTVNFVTTPNISANAGTISYNWDFGDGNTSTLQSPSHIYATGGTYTATLIVSTTLGCGDTITATITINAAPIAPTAGSNSPLCEGQTLNLTASAILGATYSWTGPGGYTSTSQNPNRPNVTLAMAGVYSVTATVAGCPGPAGTTTVVINPTPATPTASSNSPVCQGNTINLSTPLVGGASYSWTGPNGFTSTLQNPTVANAQAVNAGSYSVTVTVSGCASAAGSTTVVVNPTPATPTASSSSPDCVGQTLSLTTPLVAGATYSWSGPNGFTSSLQNPTIANVQLVNAGTYSVTVTVAGCTSAAGTTNVVINPTPATPTASSNSPICAGTTLNLSTPLVAGATYSWSGPSGYTSASQNPNRPNATVAMSGNYSVTVTVGGCTSAAGTTNVVVNPTPATPTASSNSPICAGSTLNLSTPLVGGASYSWTGPNGFSSPLQNPSIGSATIAATGTYSVTVTVGGCTSAAGTTAVTVNPIPATPTASSNSPICAGAAINLSTTLVSGATYSWTGPGGFTSSLQNPTRPSATVAMSGNYSITVTVAGCTSAAGTTAVTVNPIPTTPTASSNSPVCQGTTINLSTPLVAGATYSWTGPNGFTSTLQNPTVANAQAVNAGSYSVTVTVSGCASAAGSTTVVVNPTPATPTVSSNSPICVGATLNLSTPLVGGATYSWSGPAGFTSSLQNPTRPSMSTLDAGVYSVTVTVSGCTSAAGTTTVVVNTPPASPVPISNTPLCTGQTLLLSASTIPGATYSWTGPNGFTSSLQNPTITNVSLLAAGTYTVTANNGCASTPANTVVVVNQTPATPTASSSSPDCVGQTSTLSTPFVAGATYSWTGPSGFTSSLQNPSIPNVQLTNAGVYSVTVTVGSCTSAAGTTTLVVNPIPATPSPSSNSPICEGQTLVLTTSATSGATYSWSGPGGYTSASQNPSRPNATTAMSGTYSLTITVSGCTSASGSTSVTVNPTPAAPVASSNSPICSGNTLNLAASTVGSSTYAWTGPNGFTSSLQNPSVSNTATADAGIYSVTATENGCTSTAGTTTVVVNQTPATPVASSNSPLCIGSTLNLSTPLVGGASYSWTGPNGFTSTLQNPSISNVTAGESGNYSVTITVAGCTSLAGTVTVTINAAPSVPIVSSNSPVCEGQNLDLFADTISGATYSWTGPNGFTSSLQNPFITNVTSVAAGTYTVIADNGCASIPASLTVVINPTPATPNPNSSSPDCVGQTLSLTTSAVIGATYSWTGPNGFTSSLQNPTLPNVQTTDAGTYSLTVTVNGCTSAAGTENVVVSSPADATAGSNQTVCSNNAVVSLGGTVTGGSSTGIWTTSGTGTFSPSATNLNSSYIPSVADTTSGNITLTLTSTGTPGCAADVSTLTITITDAPIANAGTDISVCSNNPVANLNGFVSDAGGGIWTSSGSGTFSNDTDMNATYTGSSADTTAGSVMLILNSTGNGNCIGDADTLVISFTTSPEVNAGADQFVCLSNPNSILNGVVSGATTTGTWTTSGTGTFNPNANTLNATYVPSNADTTAGSVILILTSTNNGGCTAVSDSMIITYTTVPSVDAGSDQTVCANNAAINLSGTIIGGGGNGIWTSSGSGTFSPSANDLNANYTPSAADTTAGIVILTLSSTTGCAIDTDQMTITITEGPLANAGTDISVCVNNPNASLTGTVSGATTTGDWSTTGTGTFSSGISSLTNTYVPSAGDLANGSVTLLLTSTNNGTCLADIDTILITYTPPPTAFAGNDSSICANTSMNLDGIITGGSGTGTWTTSGTGTFSPNSNTLNATYNPSVADTASGNVTLTLTTTNNGGCIAATDQLVLSITDAPTVNAGTDQNLCSNNSVVSISGSVTDAGGGQWSTSGNGTFADVNSLSTSYTPDTSDINNGSVNLILTSTGNGTCIAVTDTVIINFFAPPVVNAGTDIFICQGTMTVNLNGSVNGVSTTGQWTTLGTGTFAPNNTTLNATYNLSVADTTAGTITLILESTNNSGCLAITDTVLITITSIPVVNAGNDSVACGNNANIVLEGTVIGGGGTGIWTTSGTGTFSPNANDLNAMYIPSSADTIAGIVTLTLQATQSCQAVTDIMIITYTTAPNADAGPDQAFCNQNTVSLNGVINSIASGAIWSTNGAGNFASSTSTLINTYTIAASDSALNPLQFYLTTFGSGSCLEITDTLNVYISGTPNAAFIVNNACENQNVFFNDTSTVSPGTITDWMWNFGNGDTSSVEDPTATFATTGDYTVTLIVTSSGGCTDTVSHLIHINATPNASFTFIDGCITDVLFTDNSSIGSGSITTYDWTFGDGNTSAIPSPNNVYADTGSYSVTLTVTSDSLCSNSETQIVNILPQPIAGFTMNANCGTTVVNFADTSVVMNDSITNYQWIFTNGTGADTSNVSNDYGMFGNSDVTLIVTTASGCTDTASLSFTLNDNPVADFLPNDSTFMANEVIDFFGDPDNMASYNWDFGDSLGTSSLQDTSYSYTNAGTYIVVLTVTDSLGCSDTASHTYEIIMDTDSTGNVGVPTAFTPNGDGVNDILYVRGGPLKELSFIIFNEWGNQIFATDDQSEGWDGKYKRKEQPGGVYVYILKAVTVDDIEIDMTGHVTLIR